MRGAWYGAQQTARAEVIFAQNVTEEVTMRCEVCHGTGTITLPREPGKAFGYLALCDTCRGHGCPPDQADEVVNFRHKRAKGRGTEAAAAR